MHETVTRDLLSSSPGEPKSRWSVEQAGQEERRSHLPTTRTHVALRREVLAFIGFRPIQIGLAPNLRCLDPWNVSRESQNSCNSPVACNVTLKELELRETVAFP